MMLLNINFARIIIKIYQGVPSQKIILSFLF